MLTVTIGFSRVPTPHTADEDVFLNLVEQIEGATDCSLR